MAMNNKNGAVATPSQLVGMLAKSSRYATGSQAVALRPSERVDYSVSRGGLRLWAVILLFLLLTGGLITLVSQGDLEEMGETFDMGGESDQDRSEDSDDKNLLDDGHIRIEGAESPEVFVTDERNQSVRRSKRKVVETDSIEIDDEATDANVEANEAYAEELSTSPLSVIDDPLNEVSTKSQIRMKSEKKGPLEVAVNLEESESVESEITEIRVIRRKGKPTKTKRQLATLRLEEEEESMKDSNVSPTLTIPKSFEPVKSIRKKGNPAKDPRISYSSTTDDRLANDRDGTNPPQEDVSTLGQIYKTIKGLVVKPQVDEVPIRSFRKKGRATLHQESETNGDEHEATDDKEAEEPINVAVLPRKAAKLRSTAIPNYKKAEITNRADFKIRAVLDEADRLLVEAHFDEALNSYDQILKESAQSPRAHFGRAKTHDVMSERRQSNTLLELAIKEYEQILHLPSVPEELYLQTVTRLVDRCRFRGWLAKAALHQRRTADLFPDVSHQLGLGETYLMMGRYEDAKNILENILHSDPLNGLAHVLYGFILKTVDDKIPAAIEHLRIGITSGHEGTQEHRYFYHLGDALQRVGRSDEASHLYELAATKGVFLSAFQRSVHNVLGLTAKPVWAVLETTYSQFLRKLEMDWRHVRDEASALMDRAEELFQPHDPKLMVRGEMKYFVLRSKGSPVSDNCSKAPKSCALIEAIPPARTCKRGEVKFLLIMPGAKTWAHCGPTNCRLRAQLGLLIPPGSHMRVANVTEVWKSGKIVVFDDSFEHQLINDGKSPLLLLSLDLWHPELTVNQRVSLGSL